MQTSILRITPLDFLWPVSNPFLFCAHHLDYYPPGKADLSPNASLAGRIIGNDFKLKDGWRMYHGQTVPGFPVHPHRGFETITLVQQGFVDHSDSHGQAGRYGQGDVQWMTAGSGLQHSEMFPLLNQDHDNVTELFQIWLNLPKDRKFAPPFFKMLWSEDIPVFQWTDQNGKKVLVKVIAGQIDGVKAMNPAPDSWAAFPENEVAIWAVNMEAESQWTMPPASQDVNRTLYFHLGSTIRINHQEQIQAGHAIVVKADQSLFIESLNSNNHLLVLQGKPILEPVVSYGPFVMTTQEEIRQAFYDYEQTEFGGWPWEKKDQTHGAVRGRFALHRDGTEEIR